MHLCSGYIFGCFSIWGYRTACPSLTPRRPLANFGGFGTHCRLLLCGIISVYGTWFWVYGVTRGLAPILDEDGDSIKLECYPIKTFFFAELSVHEDASGIKMYYAVITACCAVFYCGMLAVAAGVGVMEAMGGRRLKKGSFGTGLNATEYAVPFSTWEVTAVEEVESGECG